MDWMHEIAIVHFREVHTEGAQKIMYAGQHPDMFEVFAEEIRRRRRRP
jgi:hypothetical protein